MKIHHFNGIYQERWGFSWAMLVSGRVTHDKYIQIDLCQVVSTRQIEIIFWTTQLVWFIYWTTLLLENLFGTSSPLRFHDILDLLSFLSAKGWRFGNWVFLEKTPEIPKCLAKKQGTLTSDPTLTCSQDDPSSVPHSEVMAHQPRLKEHCSQGPPISNKLQLLKVSNECSQIIIVVRGGIVFIQMPVYVPCMYI